MAKSKPVSAESAAGTQILVIQEVSFVAPAPYVEGHALTAGEAVVLNQVLGENLRNNFSAHVKKAKAAGTVDALADAFATYAAAYEFHGRRATRAPIDPVAKEAHKIAKSLVLEALRKRNIDTKTLPDGKLDELISGVLSSKPEITAEAERRIEMTKSVAADALDGLV